jgi:hypothetical protein
MMAFPSTSISFFFFHCLANQPGVPRFRINHGSRGQTTAGHRVGILLFDHDTVFDEFGGGRGEVAPNGGRRSGRNRLLLRRATCEKQAKHYPSFPHALSVFALTRPLVDWQSWLHTLNGGEQHVAPRTLKLLKTRY